MLLKDEKQTDLLFSRLAGKVSTASGESTKSGININTLKKKSFESRSVPTYDFGYRTPNNTVLKQEKPVKTQKDKKKRTNLLKRTKEDFDQDVPITEPETAEDFDILIDEEDYKAIKRQERNAVVKIKISKFTLFITIALCLYIAFLLYGLIQTNYIYDDDGNVAPEILSVDDLDTLNQYNTLSNYYLRVRILYEEVLEIDYNLSQDDDNGALLAMDYTDLLDEVSKLSTDLEASQLDTAYTVILNQMYTLTNTHIAVYLQNIADALTTNDSDAATQALAGRDVIESEFTTLTSNMAMLCNATNGANNGDIYSWSPEAYMESLAEEVL